MEVNVPEGDRYERTFGAGWRSAFRYVREGTVPVAEVGDKLVKSLAETLRKHDGIPGFQAVERIVRERKEVPLIERFDALDTIVREQGGHRHTNIAVQVAKTLLIQRQFADGESSILPSVEDCIAEGTCLTMVKHYFFARAREILIGEGQLTNHERASQWQSEIEQTIRGDIKKIADQLVQNPNAGDLRAPKGSVSKKSTSDLLDEVLVPSEALVDVSSSL
ncbi:MAG: hypothetical protein OXG46_00115 [Chloroflexi bacterium]|nr:hypothetical protein [Chloroflexota bacterium]MCY3937313.1 hypothetical protein [Chloroflexota bacterium]